MTKLLARIEAGIDSGIMFDQPDGKPTLWSTGQNVVFPPGFVQPAFGTSIVGELGSGGAVTDIATVKRSGVTLGYTGNSDELYKFTDPTSIWSPTLVGSGYTGTDLDVWVFQAWNSWMIATNNIDAVQVDKSAGFTALDTDSQFTTAKTIVADPGHDFLFAFNTNTGNGTDAWWCAKGDPETWLAASSNLAGDLDVRNTESEFKCALLLADSPAVYSGGAMYLMEFVGAPDVWRILEKQKEVGAVGPHSVCSVNELHYGFGPRGIWRTDGVSMAWIDYGWVRDLVYDDLNETYLNGVVAVHIKRHNVVLFSWPQSGETKNTKSVIYDYQNNRWSALGFGISAALSGSAFTTDLIGFYTGVIMKLGVPTTSMITPVFGFGGQNVVGGTDYGYGDGGYGGYDVDEPGKVKIYTKPLNIAQVLDPMNYDDDKVTHLDFIRVEVKNPTSTLVVYVGYQDTVDGTTTWSSSQSLSGGSAKLFFVIPDKKFLRLRFEDSLPNTKWKLSAVELHGIIMG